MSLFVLLLGSVLVLIGLAVVAKPQLLPAMAGTIFTGRWLYPAALARLLIGAGLIAAAPHVALSGLVAALGWLAALGAMLLVTLPLPLWKGLAQWGEGLPGSVLRVVGLSVLAVGLLFVYAVIL
ncbi:MAG: hypothetical protein AAGI11_10620 [Pseudomonadota bacterium]